MDIAASHYTHISAAITQTGSVFMWGQCRGQSIIEPTETYFDCLDDVFACYAAPSVTFRPLRIGESKLLGNSILKNPVYFVHQYFYVYFKLVQCVIFV